MKSTLKQQLLTEIQKGGYAYVRNLAAAEVAIVQAVLDLGTWLTNHDRGHLAQIQQMCST